MPTIEEKILRYSLLPPEEQQAVEQHLAAHPELAPLLDDAQALEPFFAEARLLTPEQTGDALLAHYLVARHLTPAALPAALQPVWQHLEARLNQDPVLRARYEALAARLRQLSTTSDAASQFERLTGYALPPESSQQAARPRTVSRRRWVIGGLLALAGLYGGLYLAGTLSQPEHERLGAFKTEELVLDGYDLNPTGGPPRPSGANETRYLQALALLRDARTDVAGLFPGYDEAVLREAGALLDQVARAEAQGTFLQSEALYLLGKTHLLRGDVPAARAALEQVRREGGRHRAEADRILRALDVP